MKKIRKDNNSGTPGVGWDIKTNKWRARIWVNYQQINLGVHAELEDAVAIRKFAEIVYLGGRDGR